MDATPMEQTDPNASPALAHMRLTLDDAGFHKLAPAPPARARHIHDQFLDTGDFAFARHGITLRLRKAGRGALFTLLHEDDALDAPLPAMQPDLSVFGPDWRESLTAISQDAPLLIVAEARTRRLTRDFDGGALALETGQLIANGQKHPFQEAVLSTPPALLAQTALKLTDMAGTRLQPEPPGRRAVRLAGGPRPAPLKSTPALRDDPCLDEAVYRIVLACLRQFRANLPAFFEGDEVGAVHQMRVAMRRLRSALGLFNRVLPTPEFLTLREEAKRLASTMGEARNWDVFIAMLRAGPAAAFPAETGFAALEAQCAVHRAAGYQLVRALLEDPATTRFLLTAEAFATRRGWRASLAAESLPRLAGPARLFGAESLNRLHRKLRKHGRHLAALPAHERHLVRIELKKLRYAAEFFGPLFEPRGRVRQFNRAAAALQEELGKLNDMATAEGLAARLNGGVPEAARALGIVLGWTAHAALGEPRALTAAWKEFQAAKLFT
ncbi:CHAD domain-containing protein [Acidocella sp.]|uniref:CYTH and CHAD domain-containing protein n=1 Tax=Acidocella sp. TaxID=50710 RepID=UPI003D01042D